MPAEWEPHAATWLAWPHNATDWPGKFQPIPWVYCEIVRHLSAAEEVHVLVENRAAQERARGQLARAGCRLDRVHFHLWPTNRVWTRDSGPIFIRRVASPSEPSRPATGSGEPLSDLGVTNWKFNAWAKYDDWQHDDQVPARVADLLDLPVWTPSVPLDGDPDQLHRVVLEGGSVDVNGAGP